MILVTGGAGFIGSVLIHELNKRNYQEIIVVDRLREGNKWLNLRGLKYYDFIHADELFDSQHQETLDQVRWTFHLGACSSTTEKNVDYLMENNLRFSQKLFKLATNHHQRIIYASSAATYGDGSLGYQDDHALIPRLAPLNPYGYSKHFFDEWVLKQKKRPDIWFGAKFFNVFGPQEYHKGRMLSVAYQAYHQVKKEGVVKLFKSYKETYGDGEQIRDFVYAKDVAKAMIELMSLEEEKAKTASGIYNLGTGKGRSFNDLALAVFSALKVPPQIRYVDMPQDLIAQYQYFTEADMKKFQGVFPNFKFLSLEEAVADYVLNHLHQGEAYLSSGP